MGNFANAWSAVICTAIIICTLLEFLIPPGKTEKIFRIILSAFMLYMVLSSVIGLKKSVKLNFPSISSIRSEKYQNKFTENINHQIDDLIEANLKSVIAEILLDFKMKPKKIEIFTDKNEDNCIVMIRCKIHISKEDVKFAVAAKEKIEKNLNICTEFIEI